MADNLETPRKRRRPALSCVQCRKRKVKCDRNHPCGPCTLSRIFSCTYTDPPPKPGASASTSGLSVSDPSTVTALNGPYPSPAQSTNAPASAASDVYGYSPAVPARINSQQTVEPLGSPGSVSVIQTQRYDSNIANLQSRIKELEERLSQASSEGKSLPNVFLKAKDKSEAGPGNFKKLRYYSSSHWTRYVGEFDGIRSFIKSCQGINPTDPSMDINERLRKCKAQARAAKASQREQPFSLPELHESLPDRAVCERLVNSFLRLFNPLYHIIHIKSFWEEFEQYWTGPNQASSGFFFTWVLMMAIGTTFSEERTREPIRWQKLARQWVLGARTWLLGPFDHGRFNMDYIQVYCLSLVAREVASVKVDLINLTSSSLLRNAMQLGLHRDPKHICHMTPLEAENRRRLWSAILEIVLQASFDSGLPTLLSCDMYDAAPPSNVDDSLLDEATEMPPSQPNEVITQSSLQILLRRTFPLRLDILNGTGGCRPPPTYEKTIEIGSKLLEACQLSNTLINLDNTTNSSFTTDELNFHQNYMEYFHRLALITLHWHYASLSYRNPIYYYSRKICLDCSLVFLSFLESHHFFQLMTIGGIQFRGLMAHAGMPIYVEIIALLKEDSTRPVSGQTKMVLQPFRLAGEKILELARERLRCGEYNIKGYLLFNLAFGQVDSLISGASLNDRLYEASRESLTFGEETFRSHTLVDAVPTAEATRQTLAASQADIVSGSAISAQDFTGNEFWASYMDSTLQHFEMDESWFSYGWDVQSFPTTS